MTEIDNEAYWNETPERQAQLIASEGDYEYEHALRWVLGAAALRSIYDGKIQELIETRKQALHTASSLRSSQRLGCNGNTRVGRHT